MSLWKAITESYREANSQVDEEIRVANRVCPGSVVRIKIQSFYRLCVYAGNGKVIHYSNGEVQLSDISSLKNRSWGYIEVIGFDEDFIRKITPKKSLTRAKQCVGMTYKELLQLKRDLFALWCRIGEKASIQEIDQEFNVIPDEERAAIINNASPDFFDNFDLSESEFKRLAGFFGMGVTRKVDIAHIND